MGQSNWIHILGRVLGEARVWTQPEEDVRQGWRVRGAPRADVAKHHILLEQMYKLLDLHTAGVFGSRPYVP